MVAPVTMEKRVMTGTAWMARMASEVAKAAPVGWEALASKGFSAVTVA